MQTPKRDLFRGQMEIQMELFQASGNVTTQIMIYLAIINCRRTHAKTHTGQCVGVVGGAVHVFIC